MPRPGVNIAESGRMGLGFRLSCCSLSCTDMSVQVMGLNSASTKVCSFKFQWNKMGELPRGGTLPRAMWCHVVPYIRVICARPHRFGCQLTPVSQSGLEILDFNVIIPGSHLSSWTSLGISHPFSSIAEDPLAQVSRIRNITLMTGRPYRPNDGGTVLCKT